MGFDVADCVLSGSALTEPFLRDEFVSVTQRLGAYPGPQDKTASASGWAAYRRRLLGLGRTGGALRVHRHVIAPLAGLLGYIDSGRQPDVATREGLEGGGWLMRAADGTRLRTWAVPMDTGLDAPMRAARAYRTSPTRSALRVLLASGERAGLLTDGDVLRLLISDPVHPDSHVTIPLSGHDGWCHQDSPPDSFALLLALAGARAQPLLPKILDAARLHQTRQTSELRLQARDGLEGFLRAVLAHPANGGIAERPDAAAILWEDGLILVHRLLFVLKLEASTDPARAFSFASTGSWRGSLSPNQALGPLVRRLLDQGHDTGRMLEDGLRTLFRAFRDGLRSGELSIAPLGGALFGPRSMTLLDDLAWGERAVAVLLDRLLWTTPKGRPRERVHYGALDVEDLGGVYESLLELEPGIAREPMVRLRRGRQEIVVPAAGRPASVEPVEPGAPGASIASVASVAPIASIGSVEPVEDIQPGRFFLHSGRERKSSGSYYTPHGFVRYLVRETLGPLVRRLSPEDDPHPAALLTLRIVDPATGSGHFLVEACRFLGEALHTACRACDEQATAAETLAQTDPASPNPEMRHGTEKFLSLPLREEVAGRGSTQHSCDITSPPAPSRKGRGRTFSTAETGERGSAQTEAATAPATGASDADRPNPPPPDRAQLLARAATLRARLDAIPDPDRMLQSYLPSHASAGRSSRAFSGAGLAEWRGLAICRRLVAVHCLYGVDRNRLAVELAKLALWLESHAEGLPLTFLDHRLLHADSLSGPFFAHLRTLPVGGGPLDPLLAAGVADRLDAINHAALAEVRNLEASIGRDIADLVLKEAAKRRLDALRQPLRHLAGAWAGAAMLATREADDEYLALARHVAETGTWPPTLTTRQAAILDAGALALPWDLEFPEVFQSKGGFDAVLGNPPWDVILHSTKDFVSAHDLSVLDAPTKREATLIEQRVLADPAIAAEFARYKDAFERLKRIAARLYRHQKADIGSASTAGNLDAFRLFAERAVDLTSGAGAIGLLLPSAFHANEGTTGIRRLYLDKGLDTCLSFENRKKLFDIDSRFKFALVIVRRPGPASVLRCAFYLDSIEQADDPARLMDYDRGFIAASGGAHQTLLELHDPAEHAVARRLFAAPHTLGSWCAAAGIRLGRDLHMTDDAFRFTTDGDGMLLHEGKTFHQFTDRWDTAPRYRVPVAALASKPAVRDAAAHFRLAFRDIARASDEHTTIATILPPGVVLGHTATVERSPTTRSMRDALVLCALLNAHPFDWLVRRKAATHLSLYILNGLPLPALDDPTCHFLARSVVRLCANHAGYAPLWADQPGAAERGASQPMTWPAIPHAADRWRLRAAMDAAIAHGYGLGRSDYARILTGFSHKAFPATPALCLDAYDTYTDMGPKAFHARHAD